MTDELLLEVLPGAGGNLGCITLNRPRALNALTQAMCVGIHQALAAWSVDPTIKGVFIQGAGERAFCAGGDVRSIYALQQDMPTALHFFQQEYAMNQALYHFNKPYIAWLDGITMGGGVGVSIYGSHRVATEQLAWAMPETLIGFFPDIGAGYFLARCPQFVGYYLGLVGATIHAADAAALGLTTEVIARADKAAVVEALCETPFGPNPFAAVSAVLSRFHKHPGVPELAPQYAAIQQCFSKPTMQEIFLALEAMDTPWSQQVIRLLQQRSPTSLLVTLEYLHRCQSLTFDAVMALNLQLVAQFLRQSDFYEGVRAALIDKDQQPQWQPDELTEVTNLSMYFT